MGESFVCEERQQWGYVDWWGLATWLSSAFMHVIKDLDSWSWNRKGENLYWGILHKGHNWRLCIVRFAHKPSISQKHLHQQLDSGQSACRATTNRPKIDWGECRYSLTRCRLRTLRTLEELWNSSMRTKVCQTQTQKIKTLACDILLERVQPKLSKSPEIAQAKEKRIWPDFTQEQKMVGFDQFHNFSAPHQFLRLRTHLVPWNTHIPQTFLHQF